MTSALFLTRKEHREECNHRNRGNETECTGNVICNGLDIVQFFITDNRADNRERKPPYLSEQEKNPTDDCEESAVFHFYAMPCFVLHSQSNGPFSFPCRAHAAIAHKKKASLCISREAVGIALRGNTKRGNALRSLHSAVVHETSHISRDDRFAVAN